MTDRKHIEVFNQRLDALLSGDEPDLKALPETDLQAIHIASRLADIDLSPQSKQRYPLRRTLLHDHRLRTNTSAGWAWRLLIKPSPALLIVFPGATLLIVLVFVLGWTFTNLGRLPASADAVSATAYAIPSASVEFASPPSIDESVAQAFAPQPLPTPIAPRQFIEYTPSTTGPGRTPLVTSRQTGPVGVTRISP